MFRLAGVAQYSLPLFHAGVIPSLVLTLESPTYLSKFSNLNRVSHPQKIAGPSAKNQITVVVERPFTPSRNRPSVGRTLLSDAFDVPLSPPPSYPLGLPRHFRNCFQAVTSRCIAPALGKSPSRRWHARWAAL